MPAALPLPCKSEEPQARKNKKGISSINYAYER